MLFVISKLFDLIVSPSTLLLLCTAFGTFLTLRRAGSLWGRRLLICGTGGLLAFAVLPLGQWMMRPLEERFPVPHLGRVDGVIVLGGAIAVDRSVDRKTPLMSAAADRMTTFVALTRRYPQARLVFSGGNANPFARQETEAAIARQLFEALGVSRVTYEAASRNTHENALFTKRLVQPKPGENWVLVTSAADMPRAVGSFRGVGWQVIAMPANYQTWHRSAHVLRGLPRGLGDTDLAAHEWIGLLYYRLRGWSPSLFPGPAA